jgi:hypothetical protein
MVSESSSDRTSDMSMDRLTNTAVEVEVDAPRAAVEPANQLL